MSQHVVKFLGLALTYVAFQYTTKACEVPLARLVKKIEDKGIAHCLVDFITFLEDTGCRLVCKRMEEKQQPRTERKGKSKPNLPTDKSGRWNESQKSASPRKKNIPVRDLCDRCLDNLKTIERLQTVATSMGLPYPGEEMQPCEMCRDRAYRLYDLENRVFSPARNSI